MSVSIQSETSKDEIETEDTELEDLVWNLMSRSGLLPQIQGQIAKFIEDNGKADNVHIHPERADRRILGLIFEYLQWIGMKQTNSVLLSESPVDVDLTFVKSNTADSSYKPELCRLLEDHNETDERGSLNRSHNYSKDEFEDSRLTSASERQSVRSEDDIENEASEGDDEGEEERGQDESFNASKKISEKADSELRSSMKDNEGDGKPEQRPLTRGLEQGDGSNELLIDFGSPERKSMDLFRPNVTVRQRHEPADPFQSPLGRKIEKEDRFGNPDTRFDLRSSFVDAASVSFDRGVTSDIPQIKDGEGTRSGISLRGKEGLLDQGKEIVKQSKKADFPEQKRASPDDESTSDFMETLTIEEDTQDVSIPSEERGMSSCEHAVSLK